MKKVEQILKNGNITLDYDTKLSPKQIKELMFDLFDSVIKMDGKQYLLYEKIGILACNVSYLGHPHPLYKKRIQLKTYYLDYLVKNTKNNIKTIYLGIYTYNKTQLFVVFEPTTYANKKSHNSSAHVYSINLQYAQRAGTFEKVDANGNKIHIFNTYEFIRYVKKLAGDTLGGITGDDLIKLINENFEHFAQTIPNKWNGVDCYKEMLEAKDSNARQGEWQGFYFEFLFKQYLKKNNIKGISWHSEKKTTGVDLDIAFNKDKWLYGDLKADQIKHDILGNSFDTLDNVIKSHGGVVYYVCCLYKPYKDSENDYIVTRFWNSLRDNPYLNDEDIKNRYGKRMKFAVEPKKLCVLKIDNITYDILRKNPFAQGVNSDGNERKPKLKVSKDMIEALSIFTHEI